MSDTWPSVAGDRVGDGIQPQGAERGRRIGAGAAHQRPQPGDELVEVKRLGHVVVAPGAEAGQAIGHGVARGEEEDRSVDAARPQRLAEVAPVGVGQADVDDQAVGHVPLRAIAPAASPTASTTKPASPSPRDELRAQLGIVLDDQQAEDRHGAPQYRGLEPIVRTVPR